MSDTTSFIKKLKEKQEAQKQLVQAIDDLQLEKQKLLMERLKYLTIILFFLGAAGFAAAQIGPYLKSITSEVAVGIGNMFPASDLKDSAGSLADKVKSNVKAAVGSPGTELEFAL